MLSVQFLCLLIISLSYVSTDECSTPDGGIGVCKQLRDCPMLMRSLYNVTFIVAHYCGQHRGFCCSDCYTSYGATGTCKNLAECPNLLRLRGSMQESYILNSMCADENRVCCGPPPPPLQKLKCKSTVSAFPPDPMTECCGRDSSLGNKIVGGNETAIDEYPWLVILETRFGRKINIVCGGALISRRYVLTAAHCFNNYRIQTVLLGEYDREHEGEDCDEKQDCTDPPVRVEVEEVIVHPNYDNNTKLNDIALIRLAEMVNYTDFIRPICLPTVDKIKKPPTNTSELDLFVAGWGKVNSYIQRSAKKMHVRLPLYDMEMCKEKYKKENYNLWRKQFCAGGEPGKDSCKGDSGGPLMLEGSFTNTTKKYFEAIGIVSYGPINCGVKGIPGIYTKVYDYNTWIRSNIRA